MGFPSPSFQWTNKLIPFFNFKEITENHLPFHLYIIYLNQLTCDKSRSARAVANNVTASYNSAVSVCKVIRVGLDSCQLPISLNFITKSNEDTNSNNDVK